MDRARQHDESNESERVCVHRDDDVLHVLRNDLRHSNVSFSIILSDQRNAHAEHEHSAAARGNYLLWVHSWRHCCLLLERKQ